VAKAEQPSAWTDGAQFRAMFAKALGRFVSVRVITDRGATRAPPPAGRNAGKKGKRCRMAVVLIVAEDEQMRRGIGRTLRKAGHSPIFAHDAHSAFQELANRPDLVLLDLDSPDLEGEEVLRDFESRLEMVQIPALVLVGQRQAATRRPTSGIGGVIDTLVKPVSTAQLRQAAARVLATIHQPLDPEALQELRERQRALTFRLINDGSDALAFHVARRISADRTSPKRRSGKEALTWADIATWGVQEGLLDPEEARVLRFNPPEDPQNP